MLKYLLPFFISTTIYFYLLLSSEIPSVLGAIVKCLPIYCLAGAVYFYSNTKRSKPKYDRLILYGLLCSSIGDLCLVREEYFTLGMAVFAIAHCFYISAFGFKPIKPFAGLLLYTVTGIVLLLILPHIKDKIIFYGIPVYALFLSTMSWRAFARAMDYPDQWKILCALGSILFIISDIIISYHDLQAPVLYGKIFIMSTYYSAQFGISLSIISSTDSAKSGKKKKKEKKKENEKKK